MPPALPLPHASLSRHTHAWVLGVLLCWPLCTPALEMTTARFEEIGPAQSKNLALWQFADNRDVYIVDVPGLTRLGRTFNRLTYFVGYQLPKAEPAVPSIPEFEAYLASLARSHASYAYGHDLVLQDVARFFSLAQQGGIALYPEESELLALLQAQQLLLPAEKPGGALSFQPQRPRAALLGIPQIQSAQGDEPAVDAAIRNTVLLHELSHAEFITQPEYAAYVGKFWEKQLNTRQKQAFTGFLRHKNYATDNPYILYSEFQAYLMYTPHPGAFNAARLMFTEKELQALRTAFARQQPATTVPTVPDKEGRKRR